MFRITAFVLVAALAGCASNPSVSHLAPTPRPQFTTEEQKILACLDLQDHIVDLYASDYVSQEGVVMSSAQRIAFRDGWAEELAKRGTFDRFEQSCFGGLTPRKYECAMQSRTTGNLVACMKLKV